MVDCCGFINCCRWRWVERMGETHRFSPILRRVAACVDHVVLSAPMAVDDPPRSLNFLMGSLECGDGNGWRRIILYVGRIDIMWGRRCHHCAGVRGLGSVPIVLVQLCTTRQCRYPQKHADSTICSGAQFVDVVGRWTPAKPPSLWKCFSSWRFVSLSPKCMQPR